jgi:hypothetical protein
MTVNVEITETEPEALRQHDTALPPRARKANH